MARVTFQPGGRSAEVPAGTSLLDAAEAAGVELPHNCGGVCACVTCHVWVEDGLATLSPATEYEEDRLDLALGLGPTSRLGCQARVGAGDITVRIPGNRIAS